MPKKCYKISIKIYLYGFISLDCKLLLEFGLDKVLNMYKWKKLATFPSRFQKKLFKIVSTLS